MTSIIGRRDYRPLYVIRQRLDMSLAIKGDEMNIETENEIRRTVERFTPEQEENLAREVEWSNNEWSYEYLAQKLAAVISGCGEKALLLAMQNNDEFMIAVYNMVAQAVKNQRAINMLYYHETFDEVA
ncbi:hypothetical protein SGGMMB4_03963 [Sodalis glossinidius str. 'morsitans']|uniref:Uncharacterized protein n=1 Tax=Sodalis glossinidius (strain morsitans) TaxID=343509 RepID=A0A193QL16_SODGM|nr:hypothetical protein [Sodalis glossinidius]CRL45857.1 hypothetical protein SGGMMB4_03963 [Sodalis glossinidius str. 'morsitans']